jgi:hypothetical protein
VARLLLVAAAVVVALVAGGVAGRWTTGHDDALASAELRDGGGRPIGEAFVYEGHPAWVFVRFSRVPEGERYQLEVVLASGRVIRHAAPWAGGTGSWGATVDADPADLRALRLVGESGWHCEAEF